jgi:hypothetical protein
MSTARGSFAYEAADAGLLSPELAAGNRRVKGVRRLGLRLGNWLTPGQGRRLLDHPILDASSDCDARSTTALESSQTPLEGFGREGGRRGPSALWRLLLTYPSAPVAGSQAPFNAS